MDTTAALREMLPNGREERVANNLFTQWVTVTDTALEVRK